MMEGHRIAQNGWTCHPGHEPGCHRSGDVVSQHVALLSFKLTSSLETQTPF